MRVLVSCLQALKPHPIPAHGFWRNYFRNGLAEAGHEMLEIEDVDWAEGIVPASPESHRRWKSHAWNRTMEIIRLWQQQGCGPELAVFYLYPSQIDESAISAIRSLGVPCVHFFCDNVREFISPPKEFRCFDLNWIPEYKALAGYQKLKLRCLHAPMPCWIRPEHRRLPSHEDAGVRFIGTHDELRGRLLAEIAPAGLGLEIRGNGWRPDSASIQAHLPQTAAQRLTHWLALYRNQGGVAVWRRATNRFRAKLPQPDLGQFLRPFPLQNEYESMTRSAAVCLGINRYPSLRFPPSSPDTYSRMRDIEAPMLGACYLTEWTEGIGELYELGNEIETYKDSTELVAKARALLADPARRVRLRAAALRRAHADHSIPRTLQRMMTALGLNRAT